MTRLLRLAGVSALLLLALGVYVVAAVILGLVDQASPIDDAITTILLAIAFPPLLIRARLKLDAKDPFRLYVGDNTYALAHVTGRVEGAGKLATSDVHGGGGVIRGSSVSSDPWGHVYGGGGGGVIKPTVTTITIHDQFFIHRSDGYVAPIQLKGWDVAVADGHLVSAVGAGKVGADSGPIVAVRNHSTRGWAMAPKSPFSISRRNPITLLAVLLIVGLLFAGFAAELPGDSRAPIYLYVFGALVVGGLLWDRLIRPRFWNRLRGHDAARIWAALDAIAGAATAAPEAPASASPSVQTAVDVRGALTNLEQLRADGLISSDDYERKKQEILGRL
jgi:Short C-terminal domain